jgi:tetratricopeptide (TPR) repeat protein
VVTVGIILCVLIAVFVLGKQPQKAAPVLAPLTPEAMEDQALALQDKGDYAAAEDLFRRCLAERQGVLGTEHIDTLAAINNLANLLHDRGNDSEAGFLHQQCLEVRERTLGPDHPHTLASLNNLALVLKAKGDLAAAEPFSRRAWESMRRIAGPEDLDTLSCLNNLANLLSDKGDYAPQTLVDSRRSFPSDSLSVFPVSFLVKFCRTIQVL